MYLNIVLFFLADLLTTPKIVTIPIADDAIGEADETVNLSLTNSTGNATVGDRYNNAVLTIVD